MPKLTYPIPLGPCVVTVARAVQLPTVPQLPSAMSLAPWVVTGPSLITVWT